MLDLVLNNECLHGVEYYQNAVAERIHGILKQAFLMNTKNVDLKTMKKTVKQRVHIYNKLRPHWSIYIRTTNQMHKQNSIKISTYKNKNLRELKLSEI